MKIILVTLAMVLTLASNLALADTLRPDRDGKCDKNHFLDPKGDHCVDNPDSDKYRGKM